MLPDEQTEATDAVMERLTAAPADVPSLFWHEARNLFLIGRAPRPVCARRRRRRPCSGCAGCRSRIAAAATTEAVLQLAATHGLTAYDSAYLALVVGAGAALATLDRKLAAAARHENVPLLGPLAGP